MLLPALQMYPVALVCGNTYVFKPSERVPGASMMLVEMLQDAGCPNGVVNVIHGQHKAVNFICDNPHIRAISFVGSDTAVSLPYFSITTSFIKKLKLCLDYNINKIQ